jgi:HEPN domain-containing protein
MIDIEKQREYWINGSIEDLETAKILIDRNRILHGLFFCHFVIEKALKAHVVLITKDVAPRSHNLIFLSEKAELVFNEDDEVFLGILMKYQLQGRYPDYTPYIPKKEIVLDYLDKTERLLQWLQAKL